MPAGDALTGTVSADVTNLATKPATVFSAQLQAKIVAALKPYLPVEPYYVLVGVTALWAAIDSRRLSMSEHSNSALLSPVGLLAWMAIAWPIAFPWYLKARYHVSRGEPLTRAGGSGGTGIQSVAPSIPREQRGSRPRPSGR